MKNLNIKKYATVGVATFPGSCSSLFKIQEKRKLRSLIVLIMTLFFGGLYILLPNLALAIDCKEIALKIENHKNNKKAWEQSLKRRLEESDRIQANIFTKARYSIPEWNDKKVFSLAQMMALCSMIDSLVITVDKDEDAVTVSCDKIKKGFDSRNQRLMTTKDQIKKFQQNIRDIESMIFIAEHHFEDNNCADSFLPVHSFEQWNESGTQGWTGTWTRQGDSPLYKVVWEKGNNAVTATVEFYRIEGNQWEGKRIESSDGVICTYYGTISDDEATISGNGHCTNDTRFQWSANITKK